MSVTRNRWSKRDDATLKRMLKAGNSREEVADLLQRTPISVSNRKYVLGFSGRFPKSTYLSNENRESPFVELEVPNVKGEKVSIKAKKLASKNHNPTANLNIKSVKMLRKIMKAAREENLTLNITFE